MIVLGLDPGSRYTGYGVVEQEGSRLRELDSGRIALVSEPSPEARMARLAEGVEQALDRWQPATAALETLFHGKNSRSLIALAQARGVILSVLGRRGLEVEELSPAQVKNAVCGNGRADKTQVARMVDVLLGSGAGRRSADASDALAVAICCVQRRPVRRAVEAARSAR
ncbi:MAG: crossover junction endodeoxyribonuclease RuvC [Acidobacteria bacterium]|nr:crossover junction endodeoxyribonuclease RuvC [Acidobacteriota bacterium]